MSSFGAREELTIKQSFLRPLVSIKNKVGMVKTT